MNDAMKALVGKGEWTPEALEQYFRVYFEECIQLMLLKNHDYGNSWLSDRPTTLTEQKRSIKEASNE